MKVILFGATGMVGQGVLRECLLDPRVESILSIGRSSLGQSHAKLREIVRPDLYDLSPIERDLRGYDTCFFCLGVTSVGMSEVDYSRITHDLTIAVATTLARLNPSMTFVYVTGAGTDSTEKGRSMWARVKGRTENELLKMPFKDAYMFRPAMIQAMHGVKSRTRLYRMLYPILIPLMPLLRRFPKYFTTTEQVGRAMIEVAAHGAPKKVLESEDINRL